MLSCYRVLDLTRQVGAYAGSLLGSLGADVIKVEPPSGDPTRHTGARLDPADPASPSLYWLAYNTNKRGITLDLSRPEASEMLSALLAQTDVLIDDASPSQWAAWGLSPDVLRERHPRLVQVSITPFGDEGPWRHYLGSDLVCQALGGGLFGGGSPDGQAPVRTSHIPQAYLQGALDAAWAAAAALFERGRSAQGQRVVISIQESMERCALHTQIPGQACEQPYERTGVPGDDRFAVQPMPLVGPRTIWRTADGYVSYGINLGEQGSRRNPRLLSWMADEGFADAFLLDYPWGRYVEWRQLPQGDIARIEQAYERFFAAKTNAELLSEARQRDLMLIPEATFAQAIASPQLQARQFWFDERDAQGHRIVLPGGFCRPSQSTCQVRSLAPELGEHNAAIYGDLLGLSPDTRRRLTEQGVI